jgi:arginyl-tRNA--protein-N-Asp/Glu arginylyltransferase
VDSLSPVTDPPFESCAFPALPPPVPVRLTVLPAHDCSYLPGRPAVHRGFMTDRLPGDVYHRFMDAGFRRSGRVFYQPICQGCRECVPIRVPTDRFIPSKSQRRVVRRNADLTITTGPAVATDENYDLYRRYQSARHDREPGEDGPDAFRSFLYDSPVDTVEFQYRIADGRLIAVGITDVCRLSLSSVYFYFDPAESGRSLGTFGVVTEIEWARTRGVPAYYLGYFVKSCAKMKYKSNFQPFALLNLQGKWQIASEIADISIE